MNTPQKAALTGAIAAVTIIAAPPWFNWCTGSGPPGYICIGNWFAPGWFALPIGIGIIAAAGAGIGWIWRKPG